MTLPNADTPPTFSLALLALKRLTRGALQKVGIGLATLLTVLNLSTPPSALSTSTPAVHPQQLAQTQLHESAQLPPLKQLRSHLQQQTSASASSPSQRSQSLLTPQPILQASMTQHHLTRARLITPPTGQHSMVSLTEEK